jgi:hypothetical protein
MVAVKQELPEVANAAAINMPAAFDDLPAFEAEPTLWEKRLRTKMDIELRRCEVKSPFDRTQIITNAFSKAKESGVFGDPVLTWKHFQAEYSAHIESHPEISPEQKLRNYCKQNALTAAQTERIIHLQKPHGFTNPDFYKEVDKQALANRTGSLPNTVGALEAQNKFVAFKQEQAKRGGAPSDNTSGDLDTLNEYGVPWIAWEAEIYVVEMSNWPELLPNKWYPLDVSGPIVVNRPFDSERACYEVYPNIRDQLGFDIEQHIGRHYKLVEPGDYKMPEDDRRKGQDIPPALDPDDLDGHLGRPKGQKPAPRPWSALQATNIVGQVRACQKHFTDELTLIDPKANAGQEMRKALGMNLQPHIQKFGVQLTVDKLQAHLTNYGEKPMAKKPLTPEEVAEWLTQNGWHSKDVIAALSDFSESRGLGKIDGFGKWDSGLEAAGNVYRDWLAKQDQDEAPPARKPDDAPPPPVNIIKLDEAAIRLKYTMQLKYYDKKQNKTIYTDYLKVPGRILLFRLDHPIDSGWTIDTQIVNFDGDGCLMMARISDQNGHIVATGHAAAKAEGSDRFSGRYLEKAETSAIGRALAHAGYGTDEAGEEDFADSPVERKNA